MTELNFWLRRATRHLSADSAAVVRNEITEHYQSSREAAIASGVSSEEADRLALAALGNARDVNCQYRRVLLTSAEARLLREGNQEARMICSRLWLKWAALALPMAALLAGSILLLTGKTGAASMVLAGLLASGPFFAALFLPIYTRSRARIYRCLKWVALTGAFVLIFQPETLRWSWLIVSCLTPLAITEWTRASIRRKLPVEKWPKQLYL